MKKGRGKKGDESSRGCRTLAFSVPDIPGCVLSGYLERCF